MIVQPEEYKEVTDQKKDRLKEGALHIVRTLKTAGYEAYFVGGCVRDLVMDRSPDDYDIVTSASPEEIQSLFPHSVAVGARFGVILVIVDGFSYEVATFRKEENYFDGRHPSRVLFAGLQEDVMRRDFTINGLAMNPDSGEIIDYVGGLEDIKVRVIKTIGPPALRFAEDHLRMLRAVRLAAQLDFSIETETQAAINLQVKQIHRISAERIREELSKMLARSGAKKGLLLLRDTGLMEELLPEVFALQGVEQPREFHPEGDVFTHTILMFDFVEREGKEIDRRLAWAVLLHDIGKAKTRSEKDGRIRFYGHERESVEMADRIMERLRFSNDDRAVVLALIRHHMDFLQVKAMAPKNLKRFLRMPNFELHLALQRLDCLASHGNLDNYYYCLEVMNSLTQEDLRPPRMITGRDLISWGFTPGPLFGEILKEIEDAQLEGKISNREEAKALVMEKWGDKVSP
ncbi:MAG: CCA tRNA nucleotidyltransferase [Syntrophales bacterium]|nr:CCA tRNA nucleotidyltransferase [Syntrophales bacterium]